MLTNCLLYRADTSHRRDMAQELSAMQKQLGMCHARYEGFNLPVVLHTDVIKEAVLRLGGRWKNVPHHMNMTSSSTAGGIPKYLWQTMKQVPSPLPSYTKDMGTNNPGWFVGTMDDDDVNLFMHTVFAKTSLLWAYRQVNPKLGAMKADIWRYAVLYVFGGVYVDTDSSFDVTLDDWLKPDDGFVVAPENNDYAECYHPNFYLHSGLMASGNPKFLSTLPFDKRKLVQWLLISRPRHPVMLEALRNVVSIVTQLYLRQPLMADPSSLGKNVVCSTGIPLSRTHS